jgi:RNA polymerase sigma factor (sigma-70 family)
VSIATRPRESLEPVPLEPVDAYLQHRSEIRALLLALTREVFARLTVASKAGRQPVRTRAWLYRVAVNLAADRGRRATSAERGRRRLVAVMDERAPADDDPVRRCLAHEEQAAVTAAMSCLQRDAREAMLMAAAGYSRREIGARMGRSDLAIRTLLCRSRRRVRDALERG